MSRNQFPLLSGRTRDEQDRLLRKAAVLAFRGWRICLQGVPLAFCMALSFALAEPWEPERETIAVNVLGFAGM